MEREKSETPAEKTNLHPRNKHRERYDFKKLIERSPELAPFVFLNEFKETTIDFFNPIAVKTLNKALLKRYYNIRNWDIPKNYLCPPIPGRADYIHYAADLLAQSNQGIIPKGDKIQCLDIGVGANCVYPLLGQAEYGWHFIGSDTDEIAIENCNKIIKENPVLKGKIECRLQTNPNDVFYGAVRKGERIDLSVCNPPFFGSAREAQEINIKKSSNLLDRKLDRPILNFGGQSHELWCEGGELKFVKNMIHQSKHFSKVCFWFTTLVSKQSKLKNFYDALKKQEAVEVKTIPMGQGNKTSRILAWTFLSKEDQEKWAKERWG